MATPYTLGVNADLAYGGKVSFDKELAVPVFDTTDVLNAYAPARAGAIAEVGTDMYRWTGTAWTLIGSGSGGGGSTFLGTTADL